MVLVVRICRQSLLSFKVKRFDIDLPAKRWSTRLQTQAYLHLEHGFLKAGTSAIYYCVQCYTFSVARQSYALRGFSFE